MKGIHKITVTNSKVKYEFSIKRNITIIRGDSATGKTTLVEMINEYYESGEQSGITLNCDKECRVLAGRDWKIILPTINDSIVFVDEDNDFLSSTEFAKAVKNSDNYYVLITREGLPNLPISVDEIYGIRTSGKYAGIKKVYNELYHIYGNYNFDEIIKPDKVIVEDSNSGFEFFEHCSKNKNYSVVSASGKSTIFSLAKKEKEQLTLIIADGAAFGSEIDRIIKLQSVNKNIKLFLPESFEWLILSANILKDNNVKTIVDNPSEYIESKEYMSWERFFTQLLIDVSKGTYLQYSKNHINESYLSESILNKILQVIKKIDL